MKIAFFANPVTIHNCKWINQIAQEHEVLVVCTSFESHKSWLAPSIPCHTVLPATFSALNPIKTQAITRKIQKLLREEKVDIVHSMYAVPYAIWAYLSNFPVHIITTRGSDVLVDYAQTFHSPSNLRYRLAYDKIRKLIERAFNSAQFITSTSLRQQKVISPIVQDSSKMRLIRTGINVSYFEDKIVQHAVPKEKETFVIFSPRSMKPLYNLDIIVEAFYNLTKAYPEARFRLKLINDHPHSEYARSILEQIDSLSLENQIQVLDRITQDEMIRHYLSSDMVIMIPSSDGTPVSAIETMVLKKPLLLGNLPYDEDLFNAETVWKASGWTVETICKSIHEIWQTDSQLRQVKIDKAARLAKEKADIATSLSEIKSLYQGLLVY